MYKVYKHTIPNGKVYVGITSLTVKNRWRRGKGYKNSIFFYRAIRKYGWDNIKHEVLYDNLTKEKAELLEKELISKYQSNNKNYGYNIESGGQTGAIGIKRSKETLIKMSKANLGKKMSEETKQRMSNSLKGRKFTTEHKQKLSLAEIGEKNHMFGKKASEETREKMVKSQPKGVEHPLSRQVVQLSKETNEVIKIWDSMGDIRRDLGFKHCGISDCCRGIQKSAYGFKWEYFNK